MLRLSLHPDGLAPRIGNLEQWRAHLLTQLRRRIEATGDARLAELARELRGYPGGGDAGSAADVTVQELVIESFYPADAATADWLRARG